MSDFPSWQSYRIFARSVCHDLRFVRNAAAEEFLATMLSTIGDRHVIIGQETILWRAQRDADYDEDGIPRAHPPERMKPREKLATDGRINPKGIPCLYLATEKETAICEVRPWIGSYVSLAQFATNRMLNIIDFGRSEKNTKFYFEEPEPIERTNAVWSYIDQAFSEPMTRSDDSADYIPTQIIAETIKKEGFDGIAYRSSFGVHGYNIALFNSADADLRNCGLYRVDKINMESSQQDNPYFVKKPKIN